MFSVVDFPQPDGPTRMMNSPSAMVTEKSFTAVAPFGNSWSPGPTQFRPSNYPFTAPDVKPATIRRWKIRTKIMIGMVMTIAPAAMDPVGSSNCELPVKFAIATGAVIAAG